MRFARHLTRKHQLNLQTVYGMLGTLNSDTSTHARDDGWTGPPSIEDFAKLHPERAVEVNFSHDMIIKELVRLADALGAGGYRYNGDIPLPLMEELSNEALVSDLEQITTHLKIENCVYEYEETQDEETGDYTLIATFVFKYATDAELFRRFTKTLGFHIVEGGSSLDGSS